MIFDGINGYVKGTMNQPVGTLLGLIKGPVSMKNWFNTTDNITYGIKITAGATGKVKLQGTNDIVFASNDDSRVSVSKDFNPSPSASWADIQAATSTSATGSSSTEYHFIRLIIDTQGTGTVLNAWVTWN